MRIQGVKWAMLGLVVPLVISASCVENRQSVTILQMQVPGDDCTLSGSTTGSYIQMGRLDVWNAENDTVEYYVFPLLQNNLLSTASEVDVERNQIEIIEARVELDLGSLGSARFAYPAFLTLNPGDSASMHVVAIPASVSASLAASLPNSGDIAWVRVRLKFLYQHGEYNRVTHSVDFPVQVGRFLLFTPPGEIHTCDSGLLPDTIREGNQCNIYQDSDVDCCLDGASLVCPAVDTSSGTL